MVKQAGGSQTILEDHRNSSKPGFGTKTMFTAHIYIYIYAQIHTSELLYTVY